MKTLIPILLTATLTACSSLPPYCPSAEVSETSYVEKASPAQPAAEEPRPDTNDEEGPEVRD